MSAHHDAGVCAAADSEAADTALASVRRQGLIRCWHTDHDAYQVLVGRGTVRVAALDPAGVVDLAAALRRDRVTVVSRGYRVGHRITRYDLSDGRFADRHDGRPGRYLDQFPYTVFLPGGHESGCAVEQYAAATLREAVALAGLVRVRGRCRACQSLRALHVEDWRPDPAIACSGCGAGATVPVTVLCFRCQQPIARTPGRGIDRIAWRHTGSGRPDCDADSARPGGAEQ